MKKIFTLIATALVAMGASAQGTYAVMDGDAEATAGSTVTSVPNITMTWGVTGGANFKGGNKKSEVLKDILGSTAYCEGNGENGALTSGTVYYFEPTQAGTVTVGFVLNANKAFFVQDADGADVAFTCTNAEGAPVTFTDGKLAEKLTGGLATFSVAVGKKYAVYCTGSKLGFYGFKFELGGGGGATGETESYLAVAEDGSAASTEFANPTTEGTDLVVSFTKGNVTLKAVASRTPADIDDASGAGLNQDTWTKWNDSKWDGPKKQNDISFYWMQGSGNPYISFVSEQKSKDGEPLDAYKANYTYYAPDGSKGLPICGEYVEITAKADGMFKIGFWANKGGSRKLYLVDKESKKALIWDADETKTQYKVEGYVNGWDEEWVEIVDGNKVKKAKKRFIPYIQVNDFVIGDPAAVNDKVLDADFNPTTKVVDQVSNNAKFGWFVFDAKANNTYMIFGSDWQFGFQGYQFTPGATISDYHASDPTGIKAITTKTEKVWNADAPMYNLSGQKVDKSYKGIVIQNGRKFVNK